MSELIETEQKYVKDLQFLLAAYLEPLKKEHFWNYADLEQLYKNVKEIFIFQTKFLRILEESLESDPGFCSHTSLAQFQVSQVAKYTRDVPFKKRFAICVSNLYTLLHESWFLHIQAFLRFFFNFPKFHDVWHNYLKNELVEFFKIMNLSCDAKNWYIIGESLCLIHCLQSDFIKSLYLAQDKLNNGTSESSPLSHWFHSINSF